jgi:plastocyanin
LDSIYGGGSRRLHLLPPFVHVPSRIPFAASSRAHFRFLTLHRLSFESLSRMRFSLVAAASLPLLASAADILVQVGAGGKLAFSPPNVTANEGDTISFQFQGKNHSVTQSTFANPCAIQTTPAQGIDSGFQLVAPDATQLPQWSFTVSNASAPLWFFCAQTNPANHCKAGMVFSVNAKPDGEKSFAAYQALAMNGAAAPPAPTPTGTDGAAPGTDGAASGSGTDGAASAIASGASAIASGAGGAIDQATSAIGGAVGGAVDGATSVAGGAINAATSVAGDAINGLTAAAGQITGIFGGADPQPSGNSTGAGFAVSASPVHFLAAFGLAAILL